MAKSDKPAFKTGDLVTVRPAARKEHREYIRDSGAPAGAVFRIRSIFPSLKLFDELTEVGYGLELLDKYGPSLIMDECEIRACKKKSSTDGPRPRT